MDKGFKVVEDTDKPRFEEEVLSLLKDGWSIVGGLGIAKYTSYTHNHMMGPAYNQPSVITVYSVGMVK